ncbi:MAG TPA: carboxypeptidase regulatory-like domain-containing protein [Chloroflexota bacterium]|jgi:hypothetical protein
MTRRPRLVMLYIALLCLALGLGLLAPATSQAGPAGQAGGRSAGDYLNDGLPQGQQTDGDDSQASGRGQAADAGAASVNQAAALEQQRQQLRSATFGYAWPQPPYPGGPEARPYPWSLLGSPFLPVFPSGETSFMGITPPPSDSTYGALVRGYTTPLGFITNYDETRSYLCATRTALVLPDGPPLGTESCFNFWDSQQALLAWSAYLNRSPLALTGGSVNPDDVVDGSHESLGGWVQGETTLAQVIPTPMPTPIRPVTGPGVVTGQVRSATSGRGITGAVIQGPGGQVTVTEGGRYVLTGLPLGRVELVASYPGYITDTGRVIIPAADQPGQLDFVLSQVLAPGEVRIVLAWGASPRDLDSHLFLPVAAQPNQAIGAQGAAAGSGAHVFYAARGNANQPPYAGLDVDNTTGFGPETITIRRLFPGTYTYAVNNFSGEAPLGISGARVTVLAGDHVVQRFNVPTTAGQPDRWWTVFTLDGATGTLTPVNGISTGPPITVSAGPGGR